MQCAGDGEPFGVKGNRWRCIWCDRCPNIDNLRKHNVSRFFSRIQSPAIHTSKKRRPGRHLSNAKKRVSLDGTVEGLLVVDWPTSSSIIISSGLSTVVPLSTSTSSILISSGFSTETFREAGEAVRVEL